MFVRGVESRGRWGPRGGVRTGFGRDGVAAIFSRGAGMGW